jgi:hypothetical protein
MRTFNEPAIQPTVTVVRVLSSGQPVVTLSEYREVSERFAWENRSEILQRLFSLQQRTDTNKRSFIVIYEKNKSIHEYPNVDEFFHPPLEG